MTQRFVIATTLAIFALAAGCSATPEPSSDDGMKVKTPAAKETVESATSICPYLWTCDDVHFYSTQATCNTTTQCNGGCFQDFNCNGFCTCP